MSHSTVHLPKSMVPMGYKPLELLHESKRSLVYRALRSEDQLSVIIKTTPPQVALRFADCLAVRNQFTISQTLDHPGIIQILSLEPCHQSYALVMVDVQSIPLSEFLQSSVSLQEGLTIALQLSEVLHYLTQQRVLHKDIKPANILIHSQTLAVKLIDFGIASLLPKETQEIKDPNALEGTLAYMAPEQTGRVNRGIDFRSDFYGLGITLFELFAGQLPFQADEPMGWLHCHIAQVPPSLTEFGMPIAVANIVAKLLSKNAEDRYQSALGLKHDLERCLTQLTERKEIEPFKVGQKDVCDRFLIPEKLYGREAEVLALLAAFERVAQGSSELMLVAGFSGIGKTAVINEVHKPITLKKGYFIKGKFDQFNRNIPFSAFVQAFNDLVQHLLSEPDQKLSQWKDDILAALGNNAQVIIDVIPYLEIILGQQPAVPELSGNAAQNRFNLVFSQFVQVFTKPEHPLAIFLDDLQWADSASLNLLKLTMLESTKASLLVMGAYRDNEVYPAHPLVLCLQEIERKQANLNTLHLKPLSELDINHLVADTFDFSPIAAEPLSKLIYQKTLGNPFFSTQFIKGLYEDGYINFNREENGWQFDLTEMEQVAPTDNVVDFMVGRLQKLPEETQEVLKLAACIGNRFDLGTLELICDKSAVDIANDLWSALQARLIISETQIHRLYTEHDLQYTAEKSVISYHFLHDRVQQSAYALIPENQKQTTHYYIGQMFLQRLSVEAREDRIFELLGQLNHGKNIIASLEDRHRLAQLNLIACYKAKASAAYHSALEYCHVAQGYLDAESWEEQYPLMRDLHLLEIELEYLNSNFKRSRERAKDTLRYTQNVLDNVAICQLQVQSYIVQSRMLEAIETGMKGLELLGLSLHNVPDIDVDHLELPELEAVGKLKGLEEATEITKIKFLASLITPVYVGKPELFPKVIFAIVQSSIDYGYSSISAVGYGWYALLILINGNIDKAYHAGQVSLRLLERFPSRENECKVLFVFYNFIGSLKNHIKVCLAGLLQGARSGFDAGDVEYAAYCEMAYGAFLFSMGHNLQEAKDLQTPHYELVRKLELEFSTNFFGIWRQSGLNLLGESPDLNLLVGESFDEKDKLPIFQETNSFTLLFSLHLNKTILFYLNEDYKNSLKQCDLAINYIDAEQGITHLSLHKLYYSLSLLANYSHVSDNIDVLKIVDSNQQYLNRLAFCAPMNFQHKYDLVEAEKCRVLGQRLEALERYDHAIAGAKENKFIQEEALANELAAKFYLEWGKEKIASTYMQEAYHCYTQWGAKAKTDNLEERYPQLIQSILQPASSSLNPLDTLARLGEPHLSIHSSQTTQANLNVAFDFAAILKGAQALSESLHLDELLEKLAPMMLQNSGADRLVLLLPDADNTWHLRAIATPETTQLYSVLLADHLDLPLQLIQFVKNTQEALLVDDLETDLPIIDSYLQTHQPRSVLGLPILHQGHLSGLLYLQNQSTTGVFTCDRITVLNFLCSQAAISLENAKLYEAATLKSSIIESAIDGMAILEDGKYIYLNEIHVTLFGYAVEELMGQTWETLYAPEEVKRLGETAFSLLAKTGQWSGEATATRKDGSSFAEEISLYLLEDGKLICICRDISDRKRTTAALHLSEARATAAFEQAAVGFAETDMQTGKLVRVNTLFCEMIGYTRAELAEMTVAEITHPEDMVASKQALQQLYTEQVESFTLEKRYIRKDGTYFWSETTVYLVKLQGRQAVYSLGLIQDITNRKATERALSLTRFAIENAATSFFWVNEAGCFLDVNETACQTLGYTSEELQSKRIWDIAPSFPCDAWPENWQSLKHQSYRQFESYHQAKDGRIFPVEINSNYLEYDGQGFIFAQVQDISNRKQAEKTLLFTQYSVDNASDCTFWIKPDGRFVYANRAASSMHGYSIDELMLMSAFDINPSMTPEGWHQHWHSVKQQRSFSLESYHQTKNGRVFPVEVFVNFLEFDGEEYNFVRVRDISNRKAAEAELYQLNFELEQRVQERTHELSDALKTLRATQKSLVEAEKMAALGNLVAGVAHEINTPIGTSITVASTLADETDMFLQAMASGQLKRSVLNRYTDVAQKCSTLINSNLGRAGDLIQSFKQVAVDQTHQELRTFNLKAYLQEVVRSLQPQVSRSGHQLSLTGDNSISLTSDPGVFAQIVTNLVTNSIRHAYPSGESGQLSLRIDRQNNQIMLQYSDDGCGIPARNLSKIYEPFFTTARNQGGTGLGLNIVYNLVTQSLKGTIEIQSQEGQGTTFTIALP